MTVRKIVTFPAPILRTQTRKVIHFSPELQYLISDMIETMRKTHGVGLAAPQIGVDKQLIVVEYSSDIEPSDEIPKAPYLYVMINPEISDRSSDQVKGIEACLSIPGLCGEVERHESIRVKGLDRQGHAIEQNADGWLARIFQHEIDHLHGVLYTDRATKVWRVRDKIEEFSQAI
jgi:peptide deformylase